MRYYIVVAIVSLGLGAALHAKLAKPSVVTQTVVQERVVTRERTITRPDGTKETETERVENKDTKKSDPAPITPRHKDWIAGVGVSIDYKGERSYNLQVNRRILGDLYLGASASTAGVVGINVIYQF
jgi:hypothetical protein